MAITYNKGQELRWNRTRVDEKTNEIAKKIIALAEGLTFEQFTTALIIAEIDVSACFMLIPQSNPQVNEAH